MASSSRGIARRAAPPITTSLSASPKPNVLTMEDWESKAPLSDIELQSIAVISSAMEQIPYPAKFFNEGGASAGGDNSSRPATPSTIPLSAASKFLASTSVSGGTLNSSLPGTGGSSSFSSITGSGSNIPSRPSTPNRSSPLISSSHALHPKQPVQTPQQFYDWFALIDRSVSHSQESHFRAHVANVNEHLERCDWLLERVEEVEKEVDEMMDGWRGVEDGGKSLKDACERLLEERDRLLDVTENISSRLEYFQELEHATRMLNHPGESLVLQSDFLYMVERVDICIEYLKSHRHYKEAELYLLRFQQCMTRAMTLIKMYFVGSLRALTADVSKRLSEKDISQTAQYHLIYTRFKSVTPQLTPLLGELERRARAHPEELSALLAECHKAYFTTRKGLLVPRLVEEIRGLDPARTELVELTRAGCSYLKQVCTDEFNLYREFFSSGEEPLYQYLEGLCDYLYDDLRPRILHEPRLTALCEVCTVLQALMVLDVAIESSSDEEEEDEESGSDNDDDSDREGTTTGTGTQKSLDELTLDLTRLSSSGASAGGGRQSRSGVGGGENHGQNRSRSLGQLHISHLLQMVLQDAQTRLFFKAQSTIQSDIRNFVVKPEDLAFPEILVAARKPTSGYEIKEKESVSQIFKLPSLDRQDTWYPTLRKTVWVLSQLHDFVKPAIFEDIAQEAINLCKASLVTASETLRSKNPPHTVLDGHLFLVRHLLILKEIASSLSFVTSKDGDVAVVGNGNGVGGGGGGMTDALAMMLSRTTSLLPEALFASLGMPKNEESIRDAKHGIDDELRKACEDVISQCALPICQPLENWTTRIQNFANTQPLNNPSSSSSASSPTPTPTAPPNSNSSPQTLSQQAWASRPAAESLDDSFRQSIDRDLRANVTRLRLYVEDDRAVRVLVAHVQDRIMDEYALFKDVVKKLYGGYGGGGGGGGGGREYFERSEREWLTPVDLRRLMRDACGEEDGVENGGASVSGSGGNGKLEVVEDGVVVGSSSLRI
ncbi:Sec34-domain-containing protein [Pluteus cervinus]|uniref:Sec34-domain-containing protein n=1 Tax=Pluteus cervinus TaxID=181527 RepID=A0ACD3AN29_9AGAR|nr:Sec34-domain-containing protein [Pluteus cervinus]